MRDLLERLAKVLPAEWAVILGGRLRFRTPENVYLCISPDPSEDVENGGACFALLDWIEGKGYIWSLDNIGFDDGKEGRYRLLFAQGDWSEQGPTVSGSTRTEAVLRACVWVGER